MSSGERIYQFIEYKQLKPSLIERELGLSNGYFGKMNERGASIGTEILSKIIQFFPDLNPIWLLTGSGEMINDLLKVGEIDEALLAVRKEELPPGPCRQCEVKDQMIAALQDTIEALKEANRLLKARDDRESGGQKRKKAG